MKIFGFPVSPYVRKVLVTAKEKGLDVEVVPSNPMQPDADFLAASPYRKIPGFQDGEFQLADSTAITIYLDAKYPEPSLLPADPEALGRAVWFEEVGDTVLMQAAGPMMFNRFLKAKILGEQSDEAAASAAQEALEGRLPYLEGVLGEDGWLDGAYSLGDIGIASCLKAYSYADWHLDAAAFPKLAAWYERVTARPGWKAAAEIESAILSAALGD
ncbi:MAG TPA: glutathione S-transferase family protein [Sphingomonadaceae bacterium]|nr:glutathione S-transferase family protein [Sphingomonadaceae bacterium]